MHARRKIVLAATQALQGLVTAGLVTSVKAGRAAPMPVAQAPYLLVYGRAEASQPLTMGGPRRKLERSLTLAIEIVTASADDSDELADALSAEVELPLAGDPTLGGAAKDLWLSNTLLDARAEGETRTGRARLEFTVLYHAVASDPTTAV